MCERVSIGLIFNDEVSSSKMVSSSNVRMNRRAAHVNGDWFDICRFSE